MSDQDFHWWQLETKDILTSYDESIDNWVIGSSKFSVRPSVPIIYCQTYFDVVRVIGELKNQFNKKDIRVLYRGQRNAYEFNQTPHFLRYFNDREINSGEIIDYKNYSVSLIYYLEQFRDLVTKKLNFYLNNLAWEPVWHITV